MPPSYIDALFHAAGHRNLQLPPVGLSALAYHPDRLDGAAPPVARQADAWMAASLVAVIVNAVDAGGWTRLMHAAHEGSVPLVDGLLRAGALVNSVNHHGYTALGLAAGGGHAGIAAALLRAGANPDAALPGGLSSLMVAALSGFDGVVAVLARHGANLEAIDHSGYTALMHAVVNDRIEAVNELLQAGANPNAQEPSGTTALSLAARLGRADIAAAMVQAGAHLHPFGGVHAPALFDAAVNGHLDVVGVLVQAGVDLNANLRYAAENGMAQAVQALLRAGANVNAPDEDRGYTALMDAASFGHVEVMNILLQAAAQVNGVNDLGTTALMQAAAHGHSDAVNALVRAGADIHARLPMPEQVVDVDNFLLVLSVGDAAVVVDGFTALMLAALYGHAATVSALQRAGADIDADLRMAAQSGMAELVTVLAQAGAEVNGAGDQGISALMLAALNGHAAVVTALRLAGADIDADLRTAAEGGMAELVGALARAGANLNGVDDQGLTALMWAAANGHIDAMNTLVELRADVHARLPMSAQGGNAGDPLLYDEESENSGSTDGFTALMLAALNGHAAAVTALRLAGADLDADLRMAAQRDQPDLVAALIQAGANVRPGGGVPCNALLEAVVHGHVEVVNVLVGAGAQINPLFLFAARHGLDMVVANLLQIGADVNGANEEGFTALMLAAMNGHAAVVGTLNQAAADLHATSADGLTAGAMALSAGHLDVANSLQAAHEAHLLAVAQAFAASVLVDEPVPGGASQGAQVDAQAFAPMAWLPGPDCESRDFADVCDGDTDDPMGAMCPDYFQQIGLIGVAEPT